MVDISARRALLLDALETALKGLATIPQDAHVVDLIVTAQRLQKEVSGWDVSPPTDARVKEVEKEVLALHVGVGEVRRS